MPSLKNQAAAMTKLSQYTCYIHWPGNIVHYGGQSIDEGYHAGNGYRNQHGGIEPQPWKIYPHLLTKVAPVRRKDRLWKINLLLANHWLRIYLAEYSYNSYKYICPYINLSISCKIGSILRYLSNFPELLYLFFCPCLILYIYSDFQHIFLSYHFFPFVLKYPL